MKISKTPLLLLCFIITGQLMFSQNKTLKYKNVVAENRESEANIKVVSDCVNSLIHDKMMEVEKLLDDAYMGYGPAINDSITKQETMASWNKTRKIRTNETVGFVTQTFRILKGNLKGDWVSQWGTYAFTQNGKDIKLPYQLTARVNNGKINRSTIYYDNLAAIETLGYQITPPKQD
ncbi:hypothetical protein [Winogradskyella sp. UBA3174]|uniref:hypothetical protein n=1 Tax=Winogradskyella sp. UBA3174 TaxID=1947785 RepID=UPI0025FF5E39|nr:hypothetical protein [Winogradskyella sp. UBA3174]|tara:strand:+ start:19156 stop:19686 length:531 start_codon:yes stop_codon:yes gene_type:complete